MQHISTMVFITLSVNLMLLTYLAAFYYLKTACSLRKKHISYVSSTCQLPFVTIAIPSYNEGEEVVYAVERALSLDYPNFEVILVDDSDENASLKALERLRAMYANNPRLKVIHRSFREGFKGGALNEALKHADPRSKLLVVFDVDFRYQRSFLKEAVLELLAEKAHALQGYQCHVAEKSFLSAWYTSSIIAADYRVWLYASEVLNGFKWVTGSAFVIDIEKLREVGLFTGALTEDVDISCRMALKGFKISYSDNVVAYGKPPLNFASLIKQQMRWIEGTVRELRRHMLDLLLTNRLSFFQKLDVIAYFLQYASYLLIASCIVLLLAYHTLHGITLSILSLLSILALAPLARVFVGLVKDYGFSIGCIRGMLSYVVIACLLIPIGAYSVLRGLFAKKWQWYRTVKSIT